jgi:HK97 family phage prohead protease
MELDRSFRAEYLGVTEVRDRPFAGCELREAPDGTGGSHLTFTGYACVTATPYTMSDFMGDYTETISRNAFDRTLAEAPDVNFLMNHDGVSMARSKSGTLKLSVDEKGLHSEARLDPARPDVQILRSAIEAGDIDEMSFAFRVNSQEWNEDYDERNISAVNLHHGDVSAVNFGANPHTASVPREGTAGRHAPPRGGSRSPCVHARPRSTCC